MDAPEIAREGTASHVDQFDVEAVNRRSRQKFYQARIKIFPKRAEGFYRRLKWAVMAVTLAIYWITPWIRWDRGPFAPDQAVLVDLANRRFYFFFIEIWPQEFYYVAGLLIMAGLGLFLVTSVAGRVWCGYTCPQTVWTDLYIWVERLIEGDRNARMKLDKAPWTAGKIGKRASVYLIWLLIGVATGGAWIFYFADAPTLLAPVRDRRGAGHRLHHRRHPHRDDLRLRRLHARAGLHLYVPLAAHPGRHARRGFAARHLQRLARRAALAASEEGASRGPRRRRLRRLQCLRRGLPDGHRHPRRRPARMHHLRLLHRRLRRRDVEARQAAGADLLHDAPRLQHPCRRGRDPPGGRSPPRTRSRSASPTSSVPGRSSTSPSGAWSGW